MTDEGGLQALAKELNDSPNTMAPAAAGKSEAWVAPVYYPDNKIRFGVRKAIQR